MVHVLEPQEVLVELQQEATEIHIQYVALINQLRVSGIPTTLDQQLTIKDYKSKLDQLTSDINEIYKTIE
jgi:hypothetical protein